MSLFERLQIESDCYLCGCSVQTKSTNSLKYQPILCQFCHQHLPFSKICCHYCGLPLPATPTKLSRVNNTPCGECLKKSPIFDRMISAFHYEPPINDFITQVKYSAQFHLLPILCDYLIKKINSHYSNQELPILIIPVPLHDKKLSLRGYNQSTLIAQRLSKALAINILNKEIKRVKQTKAQSGLDSAARKSNVKNAFSITAKLPEHVAIIDDVVTTGMTVAELTKQAKLQGAIKVDIWCLARAYGL